MNPNVYGVKCLPITLPTHTRKNKMALPAHAAGRFETCSLNHRRYYWLCRKESCCPKRRDSC